MKQKRDVFFGVNFCLFTFSTELLKLKSRNLYVYNLALLYVIVVCTILFCSKIESYIGYLHWFINVLFYLQKYFFATFIPCILSNLTLKA